MELKSLVLGLLFSVGIFALKGGLGLHYLRSRKLKGSRFIIAFVLYLVGYALLFAGAAALNHRLDLTAYFPTLRRMAESGMAIHISLAALMLLWGLWLLRRSGAKPAAGSHGWLLMVLPCPLCLLVIFCSVALLKAAFPESSGRAITFLGCGFAGMSLLALGLLGCRRGRNGEPPEILLASAMIGIAAYFCLTVVIAPQFAGIDEVYRLGAYSARNLAESAPWSWLLAPTLGALVGSGHLIQRLRIRREQSWT